jgi:hypothetical protein
MKLSFRLVANAFGCGFVLNQYTVLCLEYTFPKKEICLLLSEKFIQSLIEKYGRHTVYTDGGTWYDEACNVLRLKHYLHSPLEKSLIERVVQYFKDRTECFDDYYPCNSKRRDCNNGHVYNWMELFVSMYNNTIVTKNNPLLIIKEVLIP